MKNLIINVFKTLFFFDLSFIIVYYLPEISFSNAALSGLTNEALALAVIVIFTFVFLRFVERKGLKLINEKIKFKMLLSGLATGAVFPLVTVAVLAVLKGFDVTGFVKVENWYFWIAALLVNVVANELFLRGYLFSLYKKHYGFTVAMVVTTLFYVTVNTEIFSIGKIFAANMILFNILLCLLLDYTKSVKFNIVVKFIYSFINSILLGGLSLAGEYPVLLNAEFKGNALLTGGEIGIENSVIMLILTSLLLILLLNKKYNLIKNLKRLPK